MSDEAMTDQPHDMIHLMRPTSKEISGPISQSHRVGKCDQSGDRNWKPWPSTNNEGAEGATATGWSGSWYYEALGNKKYIMVVLLKVVDGGSHIILNSW